MRTRLVYFAAVALLLTVAPRLAISQESPAKQADDVHAKVSQLAAPVPKHYYKLSFVLRETDDGKVLNQRTFTMNIGAEPPHVGGVPPEWWNVRSGTRVPVSGSKDVNYIDVGVNLDVRAEEVAEGLQMQVTSEISSVGTESGAGAIAPAIRQVKVRAALLAPIGKTTGVFTADDPASKHRFELEVTPIREK
jgi:hypothetical protein